MKPHPSYSLTARDLDEVKFPQGLSGGIERIFNMPALSIIDVCEGRILLWAVTPVEFANKRLGYSLILFTFVSNRVGLYQRVYLHKCLIDALFYHLWWGKKIRIEPHIFGSVWLKLISICAMMETVVSVFVCSNGCFLNKSNLFFK